MSMAANEAFAPLPLDAIKNVSPSAEHDDAWKPILPVPAEAMILRREQIARLQPQGYRPAAAWKYHAADGQLLGYVARYDRPANGSPAEKTIRPITFCEGPGGTREWRCKSFSEPRPLYGLPELAARPDAPVLIVEGEKTVDAAAKRFSEFVVITSPGGSMAARKADWDALAGRSVRIWPDADVAGERYANDVAKLAHRAGAASTRIVQLSTHFVDGWDLADELPSGITDADLAQLLADARPFETVATFASVARGCDEKPLPLFPPLPPAEPFPIDALGSVLSRAAKAIMRKTQVPDAIAGQSVLAAASLAAQAYADVLLPFGQARPTSLYFVTIASSGDRKTTADNEALWPINKREKALNEEHRLEMAQWLYSHGAWSAEKKKIEANRKVDRAERQSMLLNLGPEPPKPLAPFLVAGDLTGEGLTKNWINAHPALGVFTAEGGVFTGGHGMSEEAQLRTAATLSECWDGKTIKRVRATDGVTVLHGRRLAMHVLVQPEAAATFLANQVLRDQGLLSRVLVAAPSSVAGSRFYRDADPNDTAAINAYGARILSILEDTPPLVPGTRNELEPRRLGLSEDAKALWLEFYNHIEGQCGSGRDLAPIGDFAAKAAEHAARIAGVLTIVDDIRASEIGAAEMTNALILGDWYVAEVCRLQRGARLDQKLLKADSFLSWLHGQPEGDVAFREILRSGPSATRTKAEAEEAIGVLQSHGWVVETSARPRLFRVKKAEAD